MRLLNRAAFLLFCPLLACTGRQYIPPEPPDLAGQYAYFPLDIGRYTDYWVDSIVYDYAAGGTLRDSSRTLAREQIVDIARDDTGQLYHIVERLERPNDTAAWQLRRVFAAARSTTQAIRTEDNLRFLKLVFPFDRRTAWDGNQWIDPYLEIEVAGERMRPFTGWNYEVDSLDIPAQIGAFTFDSVLVVTEVNETNAIERRFSRAKYAKHVGLVWHEQWILDSQYCNQNPPPPDCLTKPWPEKAEKGFVVRQVVVGFR